MQPFAKDQRHDIWLAGWQNQRDIERVPRMTAIYPRKYCRRSTRSFYLEPFQAAAFSTLIWHSANLYGNFAVYFTLGNRDGGSHI